MVALQIAIDKVSLAAADSRTAWQHLGTWQYLPRWRLSMDVFWTWILPTWCLPVSLIISFSLSLSVLLSHCLYLLFVCLYQVRTSVLDFFHSSTCTETYLLFCCVCVIYWRSECQSVWFCKLWRSSEGSPSTGDIKCKRGSKIERWWTYRRLYLIPMSLLGISASDEFLV